MDKDNVIQFPKEKPYTIKRQYCECGSVLEMWIDDNGIAIGLCSRCHLGVGDELVHISDEDNEDFE